MKTPVLESLEARTQVFSCEYCEIFKNSFFIEHLRWLLPKAWRTEIRDVFRTLSNIYERAFCENSEQLMSVNYFSKRALSRSSPSEQFLGKGIQKICSKFTGEHPCRSGMSIKLHCSFLEIALRHGCFPVNMLHIFRTRFSKNTSEGLFLSISNVW